MKIQMEADSQSTERK